MGYRHVDSPRWCVRIHAARSPPAPPITLLRANVGVDRSGAGNAGQCGFFLNDAVGGYRPERNRRIPAAGFAGGRCQRSQQTQCCSAGQRPGNRSNALHQAPIAQSIFLSLSLLSPSRVPTYTKIHQRFERRLGGQSSIVRLRLVADTPAGWSRTTPLRRIISPAASRSDPGPPIPLDLLPVAPDRRSTPPRGNSDPSRTYTRGGRGSRIRPAARWPT